MFYVSDCHISGPSCLDVNSVPDVRGQCLHSLDVSSVFPAAVSMSNLSVLDVR